MIFFDIDETLIDRQRAERAAAAQFLESYGPHLGEPYDVESFCGRWRSLRVRHLPAFLGNDISYLEYRRRRIRDLFPGGDSLSDEETDERFACFLMTYSHAWELFDDVRPCLDALRDFPLGIISNGNARQQRLKLQRTGIVDRFAAIVISEDCGVAKPEPDIFWVGSYLAARPTEECIYVGNELEGDARAGQNAGMRCIWLNRGGQACPQGIEMIGSLHELPAVVGHTARSAATSPA